jgi:hypothetical protein
MIRCLAFVCLLTVFVDIRDWCPYSAPRALVIEFVRGVAAALMYMLITTERWEWES